ncbi:tRNA (adenosine(37)-N6)-threonylcarbamoyltransferase complex ATPase subunit type 1 TsaE [Cyanobium sp. LEGE 06113]|uniref:tRNA (adenosine(37)-N6)-threonylcarbamoyltransferase complex ATPase subunit type 1 TsaE n=1 Tax=Cyanobium sp. LEGE 06113 TaxID=1297573 RepID=UPI00351C0E16
MSPSSPPWRRQQLADACATRALGAALALWLRPTGPGGLAAQAPMLLLQGDLGSGKTCLVQGLAAALGIDEPITSPTFALAQHYLPRGADAAARPLVHLDLYRLEQAGAADELLAQEEESALELGAVLAVEWPERLSLPPSEAWWLELQLLDGADPEAGRQALLWRPAKAR